MIDLSELMPDEELGRRVSSRSHRRLVQRGNAPLSLFVRVGSHELSVDRLHDDYLPEVSAIAVRDDNARSRNFYGWAVVSQDVASRNGRRIEPTPQECNKYHADIVLPIAAVSDKKLREGHATELAARARWQQSSLK